MTILRQFDPLVIKDYMATVFQYKPHGHTYYELIYIVKGKGIHLFNHNRISYQTGDLFLISPGDHHHFEIIQPTRFVVIKFTEEYFEKSNPCGSFSRLKPLELMRMSALKENKLILDQFAAASLKTTIQNITAYREQRNVWSSLYIYFQLLSVFALITELKAADISLINSDREHLIDYIHQHIYQPQKCRIKNIAEHFNISATYFSDYFRRNYHIGYREYLNQYRISLIQKRIESDMMSSKQIAEEFGFSDESHFSNFVKKKLKQRPVSYRKDKLK